MKYKTYMKVIDVALLIAIIFIISIVYTHYASRKNISNNNTNIVHSSILIEKNIPLNTNDFIVIKKSGLYRVSSDSNGFSITEISTNVIEDKFAP